MLTGLSSSSQRSVSHAAIGRACAVAACIALSWAPPAHANDGYAELGLGGVVTLGKTYAVTMTKEVLEVSPDKIRVDYIFERNISHPDKPLPVLFPLPLYGAETPSWEWAGAPRGFSVTVDGQRQAFKTIVKARVGQCENGERTRQCSSDVTKTLKAAGLSDEQIALFPSSSPFVDGSGKRPQVPALTAEQKSRLTAAGLLDEGPANERDYPGWLADVTYLWEMAFNGRKQIEVSHQYVPFTSGGSGSYVNDEDTLRNDYCADDQLIETWKRLRDSAPEGVKQFEALPGRRVEYILTTANSWGGPIGDFTLRLKKSKPSELVLLCFPGKVRKVDPLTLEVRLKNFAPRNELRVLFVNVSEPNGLPGIAPVIAK